MKRLFLSIMLIVAASAAFAADPPRAKTKCGPWVVGVTETEMTVVWTSTERCMGWVEVAPNDETSFMQRSALVMMRILWDVTLCRRYITCV
jgi:hypothetical protein